MQIGKTKSTTDRAEEKKRKYEPQNRIRITMKIRIIMTLKAGRMYKMTSTGNFSSKPEPGHSKKTSSDEKTKDECITE